MNVGSGVTAILGPLPSTSSTTRYHYFKYDYEQEYVHINQEIRLYSFFNLGARWGWVVKARPRPLYSGKDQVPIV